MSDLADVAVKVISAKNLKDTETCGIHICISLAMLGASVRFEGCTRKLLCVGLSCKVDGVLPQNLHNQPCAAAKTPFVIYLFLSIEWLVPLVSHPVQFNVEV